MSRKRLPPGKYFGLCEVFLDMREAESRVHHYLDGGSLSPREARRANVWIRSARMRFDRVTRVLTKYPDLSDYDRIAINNRDFGTLHTWWELWRNAPLEKYSEISGFAVLLAVPPHVPKRRLRMEKVLTVMQHADCPVTH